MLVAYILNFFELPSPFSSKWSIFYLLHFLFYNIFLLILKLLLYTIIFLPHGTTRLCSVSFFFLSFFLIGFRFNLGLIKFCLVFFFLQDWT